MKLRSDLAAIMPRAVLVPVHACVHTRIRDCGMYAVLMTHADGHCKDLASFRAPCLCNIHTDIVSPHSDLVASDISAIALAS